MLCGDNKREIGFFKSEYWFQNISEFIFHKTEYLTKIFLSCEKNPSRKIYLLVKDLKRLLPNSRIFNNSNDKNHKFFLSGKKNRSIFLLFKTQKKTLNVLTVCDLPKGFTFNFGVKNITSCENFRFLGNACKWSKPILSFDENFEKKPNLRLFKFVLSQIFCSKTKKKTSCAFFDHVIAFFILDSNIKCRVYQIKPSQTLFNVKSGKNINTQLIEIGPRFTLSLLQISVFSTKNKFLFDSTLLNNKLKGKKKKFFTKNMLV